MTKPADANLVAREQSISIVANIIATENGVKKRGMRPARPGTPRNAVPTATPLMKIAAIASHARTGSVIVGTPTSTQLHAGRRSCPTMSAIVTTATSPAIIRAI